MRAHFLVWVVLLVAVCTVSVAEEGAPTGVDVRDLVLVDHAYVISVELEECRPLRDYVALRFSERSLDWWLRLSDGVVARSALVVVSGTMTRRSAVLQNEVGDYSVKTIEEVDEKGTWFVPTDPERGGSCSELSPPANATLLTTVSWCDVTPAREASCFFEVDYAYRPSAALLRAVEKAW